MWYSLQLAAYVSLALGYGLLLVMTFRQRNGRGQAQRWLETLLILAALWTLILGIMAIALTGSWWSFVWRRISQIGLVILALGTAEFADAFLQIHPRRWLRLGAAGLLVLAAVLVDLFSLEALPYPFVGWLGPDGLANLLWGLAWFVVSATTWWVSSTAYRRATGAKHRNRIRYLHSALLASAAGDALILSGGVPEVHVGLWARFLGLAVVTIAVLRYDLPDIRRLTLLGFRFVVLCGLTTVLYLLAVFVAGYILGVPIGDQDSVPTTLALLAALSVAAIVDVTVRPYLRRRLDRVLLGRQYDVQKALRAYSQQIALILDPGRLADRTLDWLEETLEVQRSAFLLINPQGTDRVRLEVLRATARPLKAATTFCADSRFIAHFYNIGGPLTQYDLDMLTWFRAMPADERQWLKDLGMDLYVPVLVAHSPVALLAIGPKASGQPYSDGELQTLMILADQTGTALENARLVDDLRAMQEDLHRLNLELAETNRVLQRMDQTKADFVAIASHELRTPLSQIYGYTDILSSLAGDEMSDAEAVHRFIQGISRGARRLKQVVDAMVDVSLLDTGNMVLRPAPVLLDDLMIRAVAAVEPSAEQRQLSITVQNLAALPPIEADGARMEQAFVHLLSNAVKFTPDGGQITVVGQASNSSGGPYVEVQIADTGIGIDPDQQELIFEKFYRGENTMHHSTDEAGFKGAGPGLGLVIARGIVEAHGGRIWVESSGRDEQACLGSTFHVLLPAISLLKD